MQNTPFRRRQSDASLVFQLYHSGVRCAASFSHDEITSRIDTEDKPCLVFERYAIFATIGVSLYFRQFRDHKLFFLMVSKAVTNKKQVYCMVKR